MGQARGILRAKFLSFLVFALFFSFVQAFDVRLTQDLLKNFHARPLGPATMGGRIVSLAVDEKRPATFYVAAASGGVWKTENNGTTWTPIFDEQGSASIGDVAIAPSDPNIVWVGTGEANARNSVAWGDGVYKSTDGGKTWKHVGLRDSHHIGRIAIHPKNPNIVYVAALGHFWGPNRERGIFKTTDGGETWTNVKFLSEDCGFVDLAMDPKNPDTLYAAAYQVRRDAFSGGNPATQFGPDAGIYKTTDGGKNWVKLTKGLPTRPMGRIGLAIYRKNPKVIYAVIQTDQTSAQQVSGQPSRAGGDVETGGIFRSEDGGETWKKLNDLCPRPFYYGQIRIDPNDDNRIYVLGVSLYVSDDGGKTFRSDGARGVHPDHHALWINPQNSEHLILGCDGGLNISYDKAKTWAFVNNLPIAQFYAVAFDMRKPYWVYGGLQDNGSWGGPSATKESVGITMSDWIRIGGGDGFYCQVDPTDPNIIYCESQYGGLQRVNLATGENRSIRPPNPPDTRYRFNWSSPVLISPHNPHTLYFGGNHLFKSLNRGDRWEVISPDLTRGTPGSITTITESPLRAGTLWVGTDDGRVHLSRDGGVTWTDLSEKLPGLPPNRWISCIEASYQDAGTAYLAVDRHRNDDYKPYLFKTTDFGETWQLLTTDLPENGSVYVIREHPRNKNLLFVGTEFGLFASLDGGAHWERFRNGLPTVAVHDLKIHPRENELIIATHGRGLYVLDLLPLQALTAEVLTAPAHLFDPKPTMAYRVRNFRSREGAQSFAAPNPPFGAVFWYYLGRDQKSPVKITITDPLGNVINELEGAQQQGLHQLVWNLRPRSRGPGRGGFSPPVAPGDYVIKLSTDENSQIKKLTIVPEE